MMNQLDCGEPLSQVCFVHDYIQLHFQEQRVTVFNTPKLSLPSGATIDQADVGFCDKLVSQIGQSIQEAGLFEGLHFIIRFGSGVEFIVQLTSEAANSPEALELPGAYIVFNT